MTHLAFFSLGNPLLYGQNLFGYVVDMIQFEDFQVMCSNIKCIAFH